MSGSGSLAMRRSRISSNRLARWSWLGELKQPDGGFRMVVGGEEDVRLVFASVP